MPLLSRELAVVASVHPVMHLLKEMLVLMLILDATSQKTHGTARD